MSTILVTGGAGFIGSHVIKALIHQGHKVVCLDNFNSYYDTNLKTARLEKFLLDYDFKVYKADVSNPEELCTVFKENKIDKICHLAAQAGVRYSLEDPDSYIRSNIIGTHNILEAAKDFNVTDIVLASSSSVYSGNEKLPWTETDPVDKPTSLYAATKKANEVEAYTYHHLYNLNIFCLRFFTVYGPWGRPDMAYYLFTKAITAGETIDVYNQGKMRRDFTYIDDIVSGVTASLDKVMGYEILNLGNNNPIELEYFISQIEKNLGQVAKKNYLPMQKADFLENFADTKKAKEFLNWEPKTNIEEGMQKFIFWFKDYHKI